VTLATLAALRRALDGTRATRENLDRYRDERVRAIVRHAYENVAYYRNLFDSRGIDPRAVRGVADLHLLPLISKQDLQSCDELSLIARGVDARRLIMRRTTGSTGQPLRIRRTWSEERLLGAFRWRALRALGWKPTDRHVEIEEPLGHDANDLRAVHALFESIGLLRQTRIDALASPEQIARQLRAAGPDVLCGYAGVVAHLCDVTRADDLAGVRPRFVAVHSDTLTARMRAVIGAVFRAPVYELYDCNEFNLVAWQCAASGALHVCDDTVVLVVLVDGRPATAGERGEAVITSLHSAAMPFIRYRIGDVVVRGEDTCSCGRAFSTIRAVQGRMFDYFPLADGRVVHPYELIAILDRTAPWLLRYRMTQERRDHLTVEVVARTVPSNGAVEPLRAALAAFLGPEVGLDVALRDELPIDGSGKLRICRSLVASEYDATQAD
jgi:phenylacetate-CoA ligase